MSEKLFHVAFQYLEQEPRAAARLLEIIPAQEMLPFLSNTPALTVTKVLQQMQPEFAAGVISAAPVQDAQLWLQSLSNRQLCAILRRCDNDLQHALLDGLTLKKKTACQLLLSFREDMVGAIVETDIMVFPLDMTVEETLKRLKQREYSEQRIAFAVDQARKLSGEIVVPQLLRATKNSLIADHVKPCDQTLSGRSLIRAAISNPIWHTQDYAAVINRHREIIGLLWFNQVRQYLSSPLDRESQPALHHPALDMLHAHGDSIRSLLDTLLKLAS